MENDRIITIQMQDLSGNWIPMEQTDDLPLRYLSQMQSLKRMYPDRRIRAVDNHGRVVDILY